LCAPGDFPVAERMAARVMSLPMGPYLAEPDVQLVATTLLKEIGRIEEEAAADGVTGCAAP
jgi:dTDP-4-amino-4,6-dideoxygalactose transaminase